MSVADRLNKLSTDITNAYTSINNKGGTIPANKNTNNLSTAIDSIQSSNIIGATAEGESLSLTNTKAMPYSDYVVEGKSEQDGEPSPSNPSEIHSVADDVNLFDVKDYLTDRSVPYTENIDGSLTFVTSSSLYLNLLQFSDTDITVSLSGILTTLEEMANAKIEILNSNNTVVGQINLNTLKAENIIGSKLRFNMTSNKTITLKNIKLQKGSTSTPYSPYNQGTVTIKQRGKNLFDIENYSKSGYNVTITNPLKGLIAGDYTISCQNKHTAGSAIIFSNEINGSRIGEYFTGYDFGRTLTSKTRALTQEQLNAKYMIFQGQDSSITQEVLENMQIQIEKGSTATSYEPYQANDYTIQTAPLRSLPNGVKDTIEEEQHRKIGKQTGTLTETTTITLSDAKTNGAYMCNIKPSGTLTGKTIELEAGDYEIIYELEQETIEPLTQNQATTMLDIIKTGSYEGTTNIYTDEDVKPTIGVGYYKKG